MKKILLTALVSLFLIQSHAWAASFARLTSDRSAYTVGQKAVLMAFLQTLPQNTSDEVYMTAKVNGVAVNITQLSNREWVSLSPVFGVAGNQDWEVSVYLEDKASALALNSSIAFCQNEIFQMQQKMASENDPDARAILQQIIDRDNASIATAQQQLAALRRLMEVDHLSIAVNPALEFSETALVDPMTLTLDSTNGQYAVGTKATLSIHVNPNYTGADGAMENVMAVDMDGVPLITNILGNKDFSAVTQIFTAANVGTHQFHVTLSIRSKAEASALRDAVGEAQTRLDGFQEDYNNSTDPLQRAYDQKQINDLAQVIAGLNTQLQAILTQAATASVSFVVN